ncbi:MAG TPA: hypothetical protein VLA74_10765 [Nitrososphaeraceae archaeon]|nr:hypothetical protein [Nitrososphaeraceae archaeon]
MTGNDMTKNNSTAMQTGQQMKGMDMEQMMKTMPHIILNPLII